MINVKIKLYGILVSHTFFSNFFKPDIFKLNTYSKIDKPTYSHILGVKICFCPHEYNTSFNFEKMVDVDFVVIMIIDGHIFLCCDYVSVLLTCTCTCQNCDLGTRPL